MLARKGVGTAGLIVRLGALAATLGAMIAVFAAPATATTSVHSISKKVALIPQNGPVPPQGPNGIMPISSFVTGRPTESFDQFSFSNVGLSQITSANLAQYDTVALIQVRTSSLTSTAKAALAQFVANGGKLIIHDSDETGQNDYSWLLPGGSYTTKVGLGCFNCGSNSGNTTVMSNSSLISANPADPSYVNLGDLYKFTDVGDSNLLVSTDPRWTALTKGTNGRNESGAQVAFASNNNGLIVYNGFDTDFIKTKASDPFRCNDAKLGYKCPPPPAAQPTVDYLAQMWYSELVQGWGIPGQPGGGGGGLPHPKPVVDVGTPISAAAAGLPSNRRCVARRTLLLRLKRLSHLRHRKVVQADVYVDRKHVLRERRHFTNKTLKHLPRHGRYTVKVVATTVRGYHLIAKQRYRAC